MGSTTHERGEGSQRSGASNIKDFHVETCLQRPVESGRATGFSAWELVADLPDYAFPEIDTRVNLLGKLLEIPLIISSMTGGGSTSLKFNRRLAEAARECGLAMAVGSQHIMLDNPRAAASFRVRPWAPDILLLADLGLVHLARGLDRDMCLRAVEAIGADGLFLYINPMHETAQLGGNTDFSGIIGALEQLASTFPYPLLVKEVGFGLDEPLLRRLAALPLAAVDVAGAGGTNWGRAEAFLNGEEPDPLFDELGVPTAVSLQNAVRLLPSTTPVISSGGVRTGLDIAKSLALGARATGMALPFLRWANVSTERIIEGVRTIDRQLRLSLWYAGAQRPAAMLGRIREKARTWA